MRMSVTTTSGRCSSTSRMSAGRSPASPTSSRSSSAPTRRAMPWRRSALSSASATRITAPDGSGPPPRPGGEGGGGGGGGGGTPGGHGAGHLCRPSPCTQTVRGEMQTLVVAYRLRATVRRRLGGHVAIALLVAVLGGTAMASIAAARRTQSSYAAFLASTHPSDLTMTTYGATPGSPANNYSLEVARRLAQLPGVEHV